jgi:hypothetical protein
MTTTPQNVPVTDLEGPLKGFGTLDGPEPRGVQGGVPYGEQLENERRDIARMYRFRPGAAARLRAATRSALRRG